MASLVSATVLYSPGYLAGELLAGLPVSACHLEVEVPELQMQASTPSLLHGFGGLNSIHNLLCQVLLPAEPFLCPTP